MKQFVQPWRPTLGAWLAFAFSAMSVLLTVLLTLVIGRSATQQVAGQIGSNLAELANQTTSRLDRGMYERHREIQLLAQRLGDSRDWFRVQAELDAVQASYKYYAWIGLADLDGVVRAASRGMLVGGNVSQRPWFQEARKGVNLGEVHEALLLANLLGGGSDGEPLRFFDVAFSVPGGVLGAHVSWQWAKDVREVIFRQIGRSQKIEPLIVSAQGRVHLGPKDVEGRTLQLQSLQRAQRGETGYVTETWPDGETYLVGYSKARGYAESPGLGWSVLVRQDLDEAYAPVGDLQKQVLVSGITIAVLFLVLGWLIARAITRPLLDLAASARTLDSGEVRLVRNFTAYREVATLGAAINSLVSELQRNETELRHLNATLERRVEQRTAQLRDTFQRVRDNEKRIQTIIEAAQDPFIAMDLQGRITDWNSKAEVVFGWTREEAIGRQASEILVPRRYAAALEHALRDFGDTGELRALTQNMERVMIDRQGREIQVELRPGLVSTGEQRFLTAFVHDISERKEVERMKDEFISTVSHELRTPLTAIYGSLDLMVCGAAGELPEDVRMLLKISHESTERLIRLINDMLDLEKMASGKIEYRMQRQPLRPLVEHSLRDVGAYAEGLGIALELAPGGDAHVNADADRIVQVCVNLLSNAAKFSPAGGTVRVRVEPREGVVRVCVEDNGQGIPAESRDLIFQRFSQVDASDRRAKGGTGLGLSICRSIVLAHGGQIGFESEPGVRTVFWFELAAA
jgi:PAS domain S-box-containing protein